MNFSWKRALSLAMAVFMVVGMVPFNALALTAEGVYEIGDTATTKTDSAPTVEIVDNAVWEKDADETLNPNPDTDCGYIPSYDHTHGDNCYTKSCDHKNGHLSTCYPSSNAYAVCPDKDTHAHTGTANLGDVVTINGTDVQWVKTHPAYSAVYAIYKAAYDEAYASARFWKDAAGKAAGVAAVAGVTVCYTTTQGEDPTCGHVCSAVAGSCYTKICVLDEHVHTGSCWVYSWTLKADANNNQTPDEDETYTVIFNGHNETVSTLTGLALGAEVTAPADPTREYYTFAGWSPAVESTVVCPAEGNTITYTATWTPVNDVNGNDVADEEETYTVVYMDGETVLASFEGLAYNAVTPNYEASEKEGFEFLYWNPTVASNVSTPTSGNTITYTAVWKELGKIAVTFVDRDSMSTVEYWEGESAEEPAAPTWDADHDFLGWYNGDTKYDFSTVFTADSEDLTLTAKWQEDYNHNDIDDAAEAHYTVKYVVDGVEEVYENILTGMPTPEYSKGTPTKAEYTFSGWDVEVAETVTDNATYTATWIKDINQNNVEDADETITVVVNGEGTVTVNGDEVTSYVYDSTVDTSITVVAAPVVTDGISSTYVSAMDVDEASVELAYGKDFTVTHTFTAEGAQTVTVTFTDCGFIYNDNRLMNYYDGMPGVKNEDVYNTIVSSPAYADGDVTITYMAREATSQTVDLKNLGLNDLLVTVLKTIGYDTITIDMDPLWLNVNVEVEGEVKDSVSLDQAVAMYLNKEKVEALWNVFQENGGLFGGGYAAVETEINAIIANIKNAAMYYGAHNFGYNATGAETVTEQIKITFSTDAYYIEGQSDITLKDLRAASVITGNNVELMYKDYTDEDLWAAIGAYVTDENGNAIEGAVVTAIDITDPYTYEGKYASETPYELTVKFAGNENYKPSEATFTVTITKAPASIDVHSVNVFYGEEYNMDPEVTLGNQYGDPDEITESLIQFVIGLDVSELDVDGDGIKGLNGKVQLILPADLQSMLDGIIGITGGNTSDGMEMSMSELMSYLEPIEDSSVDSLKQALDAISSITETGDITIVLGGDLPTNIGAYLYGAVSTSSNYETAFDAAYIIIKPVATQVWLDWNYTDANNIFSWQLLQYVDLGASAFNDAAFTDKNADATTEVTNVFFGINENGEFVAELFYGGADAEQFETTLGNGLFTQLAFITDFGNELYYATPIVRAFLIVPNIANVELVDAEGNALDTFTFTYDKTAKELFVTVDGELVECDITYTGIRTNGEVYKPTTEAPVHAGVYTALTVYVARNEKGDVLAAGGDLADLIIEPAQSTISVTGGKFEYDGQPHGVTVEAPTPDVTLISGYAKVNGDIDEIGLDALEGNVNVDFPAWLDEILSEQFADAYANGVAADDVIFKLNQHKAVLVELGVSEELIADLITILEKLPTTVVLTFNDTTTYTEPGAYVYVGIVTDSDYIPSYDTGLVVIQKEALVLDMMDTTVTWDGKGHFIDVYNPDNTDYVSIIIDRENNIGNIILEDDLNALVTVLEETLERELPESIDVAELHAAIEEVLTKVETLENIPVDLTPVLTQIRNALAQLPQSGTVYINGEWLPTEIGEYEFYGASYSAEYATNLTEGILTIVPIEIKVEVENAQKYYGETDPTPAYTVKYYDHEGNELTGFETDVVVDITRAEGEDVGSYTYTATVTVADEHYVVTDVTADAYLEILPAEITVVVNDASKIYGDADPVNDAVVTVNKGVVDLTVTVSREEGENVGEYDYIVDYVKSENYIVTETIGKLTITPKEITETDVALNGSLTYNGAEQTQDVTVTEGVTYEVSGNTGTNAGDYTLTVTGTGNYTGSVELDWSIAKAQVTITVENASAAAGTTEIPEVKYTVDCTAGKVTEEQLNVSAKWDVDTVNGNLVHGEYEAVVDYTKSENWDVTVVNGKLTVELGDYVCWNMQTGVYYDDLSDALDDVDGFDEEGNFTEDERSIETIQMLKDYKEQYVVIAPGTTLDLDDHTVTASYVVGMEDSFLTGEPEVAKLKAKPSNISLDEGSFVDELGYDILPIYNPAGYFQFSRFEVSTAGSKRGLKITEDQIYFQFVTNASGFAIDKLMKNGINDNELSIVVRLEWETSTGKAYQDFVYSDNFVIDVCGGGKDFFLKLTGYEALGIDLSTLTVKGMVIANSGVASVGVEWTN